MSWRALTEDDLVSFLSNDEVDAYRASAGMADVVADILAKTGDFVRGHVRSAGVALSTEASAVPDSLVSPALDYAVFDVLKRMGVPVSDDRRTARQEAIALFQRVAEGKLSVEPGVEDSTSDSLPACSPAHGCVPPPHLLD